MVKRNLGSLSPSGARVLPSLTNCLHFSTSSLRLPAARALFSRKQ